MFSSFFGSFLSILTSVFLTVFGLNGGTTVDSTPSTPTNTSYEYSNTNPVVKDGNNTYRPKSSFDNVDGINSKANDVVIIKDPGIGYVDLTYGVNKKGSNVGIRSHMECWGNGKNVPVIVDKHDFNINGNGSKTTKRYNFALNNPKGICKIIVNTNNSHVNYHRNHVNIDVEKPEYLSKGTRKNLYIQSNKDKNTRFLSTPLAIETRDSSTLNFRNNLDGFSGVLTLKFTGCSSSAHSGVRDDLTGNRNICPRDVPWANSSFNYQLRDSKGVIASGRKTVTYEAHHDSMTINIDRKIKGKVSLYIYNVQGAPLVVHSDANLLGTK